jgi:hypothetical protein
MDTKLLRGFEHYLAIEYENLSSSIAILEKDYQLIFALDNLYNVCLNITLPDEPDLRISAFLYLTSHQEYYSGIAAFLRLHNTQSFRCLRAALDSTFTAYYLLKNPDKTELYVNKNKNVSRWDELFRNIKATIKNNEKIFPLAVGLPEIYDLCSKFAHADPEGIFHRYFIDKEAQKLHAHYFDYERTQGDYKKWYVFFMFYFFKIFLIYWNEMLKNKAGRKKKSVEYLIKEYKVKINDLRKIYPVH